MAKTERVCERCGMEEKTWSRSMKFGRTDPCRCGSRHLFCPHCMSVARGYIVRRFQRGGGKKTFFKVCPVSDEEMVAQAMMKDGDTFKPKWWFSNV